MLEKSDETSSINIFSKKGIGYGQRDQTNEMFVSGFNH